VAISNPAATVGKSLYQEGSVSSVPIMSNQFDDGWRVLDEILLQNPGRTNGERSSMPKKDRMTKREMKTILEKLFNITDSLSIDVVWEHMQEVWAKEDGEC